MLSTAAIMMLLEWQDRQREAVGPYPDRTTAKIYAHAIASAQAKAMQTFDRFNDLVGQEQAEEQPSESMEKVAGD